MRIGIVFSLLQRDRGGAGVWTTHFIKWLISHGHAVHVLAQKCDDAIRELGAVVHPIKASSGWGFAEGVDRKLNQLPLDVVHDLGYGWNHDILQPRLGIPLAVAERSAASRSFVSRVGQLHLRHVLPRYRRLDALAARQFENHDTLYLALSNMLASDFHQYMGVPCDRIRIVRNGVDVDRFSPERRAQYRDKVREQLGVPPDELLVLLVAHSHALKGVPTLIKAASQLVRQDGVPMHVAIVGGTPSRSTLRLSQETGIADRVHFTRCFDPVPYYGAADIYAHPTYYDACSNAVLEALASGLPVITTRVNGASDIITHGIDGLVMPQAGDADDLANYLRFLVDPFSRQQMGDAARALAEKNTLEHNFREMLHCYQSARRKLRRAA